MSALDAMQRGFRTGYLDHAELTAQLRAWADAFPELVRLEAVAHTPEGREVWLLTVGREPDRVRPAAVVDANLHASELAGSSVALAIAEDLLRLHVDGAVHDLAPPIAEVLADSLVYVFPRVSPDGAETVLRTGAFVRSVPRDTRRVRRPRWVCTDLDGDGLALLLRVPDPSGEFVESAAFPGLLVPREPGDPGPWYKVWPEGVIEDHDGFHVPDPDFLSDNYPDLNRTFAHDWRPEHAQAGAGDFPGSEPETRALLAFGAAHPHVFAWLDLHCFGGVHIRPSGQVPDVKMDPGDLALYRFLARRAEARTGYPMVSGFEEFTYEPETPLRGDLSDWAFEARGCVSWAAEIWDLFAQLGLDRPRRFVDWYTQLSRADLEALARWDAAHNAGRIVRPWRPVEHPQLGPVEVGGLDPRIGCWNPPPDRLGEVCRGFGALWLEVAALAPRLGLEVVAERLSPGVQQLTVTVRNTGYLSTSGLPSAARLAHVEPVRIEVASAGGTQRHELGHLLGWGRGFGDGSAALYFQRSKGGVSARTAVVVVRGSARVRAGSARVGWVEAEVADG